MLTFPDPVIPLFREKKRTAVFLKIAIDSTLGGSGHVKRLEDEKLLVRAPERALDVVAGCTCDGDEADASCYGCLRNYRNQGIHGLLKRRLAIQYLGRILH